MFHVEYKRYTTVMKNTSATGAIGEAVAVEYLNRNDYQILEQNYRKPWVEIDIIAKKESVVHIIEVKTVSYETISALEWAVSHETWRPEEQVHARKLYKLGQGAEAWIHDNKYQGAWQIDVLAVRIVPQETYATVKVIPNVIAD